MDQRFPPTALPSFNWWPILRYASETRPLRVLFRDDSHRRQNQDVQVHASITPATCWTSRA